MRFPWVYTAFYDLRYKNNNFLKISKGVGVQASLARTPLGGVSFIIHISIGGAGVVTIVITGLEVCTMRHGEYFDRQRIPFLGGDFYPCGRALVLPSTVIP